MFEGFLKSKFYNKSKTAIKVTKMRLEAIKKKRAAVDRYLRKDIADLLRNDLDINAYDRAEGLLVERNMTSCYDFVNQFCGCISSSHVVVMQKQSECPEECKEAVASLMYAAARFADLPELRELRTLFREKYGASLESLVNEEFAGKLRSKPSSKDLKIQLMQDIAAEFSVEWNSMVLEQKLFDPNSPKQESNNEDERKPHTYGKTKDPISVKLEKSTSSSSEDDSVTQSYKKADRDGVAKHSSSSSSSPLDEEVMQKRPPSYRDIIPPYVKSKADTREGDGVNSVQDKPKPMSVRQRRLKPPPGRESAGYESGAPNVNEVGGGEEMVMGKVKGSWKLPHSRGKADEDKDEVVDKHAPARASSLPLETTMPEEATETGKGHCRSASLQPEVLAGHVHPNLPDYDNLAERIAALRGR